MSDIVEYDRKNIEALDPLNAENTIDKLIKVGELLVKSGFLPDAIKQPAQAVAIILTGREMGIPMMQSLRQIHVIQGKPTVSAELMLSQAFRTVPGFQHEILERSEKTCKIKFKANGRAEYIHEFSIEDAKKMGLANKDNWIKQPKVMLFWRAISGGLRAYVPQAVYGVYITEELAPDAVQVSEDGVMTVDSSKIKQPAITPEAAATEKKVAKAKKVEEIVQPTVVTPEVMAPVTQKPAEEPVVQPISEEMVLKIVSAFSKVGITREQLVEKLMKPTTEWFEQDRTNLLGQWKRLVAKEITSEQFLA